MSNQDSSNAAESSTGNRIVELPVPEPGGEPNHSNQPLAPPSRSPPLNRSSQGSQQLNRNSQGSQQLNRNSQGSQQSDRSSQGSLQSDHSSEESEELGPTPLTQEEIASIRNLLTNTQVPDLIPAYNSPDWLSRVRYTKNASRDRIKDDMMALYGLTNTRIERIHYTQSIKRLREVCCDIMEDVIHLQEIISEDKKGGCWQIVTFVFLTAFAVALFVGSLLVLIDSSIAATHDTNLNCTFTSGTAIAGAAVDSTDGCKAEQPSLMLLLANAALVFSSLAFFVQFIGDVLARRDKGDGEKARFKEVIYDQIRDSDNYTERRLQRSNLIRMMRFQHRVVVPAPAPAPAVFGPIAPGSVLAPAHAPGLAVFGPMAPGLVLAPVHAPGHIVAPALAPAPALASGPGPSLAPVPELEEEEQQQSRFLRGAIHEYADLDMQPVYGSQRSAHKRAPRDYRSYGSPVLSNRSYYL